MNIITPELVAYARRFRYEVSEGFREKQIEFSCGNQSEEESVIFALFDAMASELSIVAGIPPEQASEALASYMVKKGAEKIFARSNN